MMKKSFLVVLTLAAVFFGSCVSEDENPAPFKAGETVEVKFRVGLESSPKARSSDQSGYSNVDPSVYSLRYKVAVYLGDKDTITAGPVVIEEEIADLSTDTKVREFSFRLTLGTVYTVVGWADFVETGNPVDKFYDTQSFPEISLKDAAFTFNEEAKDAYFGVWNEALSTAEVNVPLKRPFGKIRFLVSDYTTALKNGDRTVLNLSTEYYSDYLSNDSIYTTLNMLTGVASGDADATQRALYTSKSIDTDPAQRRVENGELVTFWDYILAPSAAQIADGTSKPQIEFAVNYSGTAGGTPITPSPTSVAYVDPRIVVERNKLTTVRADLFGGAPTVVRLLIEDEFETPELEPLKVYVVYTDGGTSTVSIARDADSIGSFKCPKPVRAITLNPAGGDSIYIGTTKAFQTVTLKFIDDKTVGLRNAVSGFIPVNSIAELQLINTSTTTQGAGYILEGDVDLLSRGWTPISAFTGTFDGAGHTVSNLRIASGNSIGFFGAAGTSSKIKNLGVSGSVSGGQYVGGIVGFAEGSITACSFDGTVKGNSQTGGIAGRLRNAAITACSFNGTVNGAASAGGLVGYMDGSSITACHTGGTVTGSSYTGSLVGLINDAGCSVTACYSTAGVTGGNFYGDNLGGTVSDCFTSGTAQGGANVVTKFGDGTGGTDWPTTATHAEWGIGNGTGSGLYWKELGSFATSVYPTLWWE